MYNFVPWKIGQPANNLRPAPVGSLGGTTMPLEEDAGRKLQEECVSWVFVATVGMNST